MLQSMRTNVQNWNLLKRRLIFLTFFILCGLLILLIKLFMIQVVRGSENYEKSQRVIRRVVTFSAPRGEMFDRHFQSREKSTPVVSNTTHLSLVAIPGHFKTGELEREVELLEKALGKPAGSLTSVFETQNWEKKDEITIIDKVYEWELTLLADFYIPFSRFIIKQNTQRNYLYGNKLSHVTGYIGSPTTQDIQEGVGSKQWVGKNGLEKYYDSMLRGEDGEIVQLKTATGSSNEQEVFKNFIPGNNLVLTIDIEMQETAWKSLGDKRGAVVVLKPATGEVLAMVSKPDYNPNILVSGELETRSEHLKYMQENFAELNRAISAKYPPASTYKPLVALTAMEEKQIPKSETYYCPGKFVMKSSYANLADSTFHCWAAHGKNDMIGALAESCSVYFYELGQKVGVEPMIRYSRYFHFDQTTGVDLPGEISGFLPSPEWKEKQFRQRWFDGDTVNLSIGQGFIETTLMEMVNFYAAIVTGGVVYKPHLIKEIRYAENDEIKEVVEPEILYELPISPGSLEVLRTGLRQVVKNGTAKNVLDRKYLVSIAGKTGTVQTRSFERFAHKTQHAWFVGYAPYRGNIENVIVVGVFVEQGIGGAIGAAPVAHDMYQLWSRRLAQGEMIN